MGISQGVFCLWWLLVNAFISFAEFQFLLRFPFRQKWQWDGGLCIAYMSVNCVLTMLVLFFPLPVLLTELLHIAILFFFPLYLYGG